MNLGLITTIKLKVIMTPSQSATYKQNQEPKARFTGIFIPVEILNLAELTPSDIILLSWIDALYDEEEGGCWASNKYFSEKLNLSEKWVSEIIMKLMKMGLIEKVSYNGRIRIIRACKEKWYQPESDSGYNRNQTPVKTGIRPPVKPESHHIYSKEESKEKDIKEIGRFVRIKKVDYDKFLTQFGQEFINEIFDDINDYCANHRPKGYTDYAAAFRTFLKNKKTDTKSQGNRNYGDNSLYEKCKDLHAKENQNAEILVSRESVTFILKGCQSQPRTINFKDSGAKEQINNELSKREFKFKIE